MVYLFLGLFAANVVLGFQSAKHDAVGFSVMFACLALCSFIFVIHDLWFELVRTAVQKND